MAGVRSYEGGVTVQGTEQLRELLRHAGRLITVKEMQRMMIMSAKPMVEAGKADAMRVNPDKNTYKGSRLGSDFKLQPGVISKSIGTKVLRNPGSAFVIVAPIYRKDRSRDPWFSHFVHEGTAERSYKGMSRGKIAGSKIVPFMERAGSQAMRNAVAGDVANKLITKLTELGL